MRTSSGKKHPRPIPLQVVSASTEALERRVLLSAFTVTNTADSGAGSLRDAINGVNAVSGASTVTFDIPGTGVQTIALLSPLPVINRPVVIDGSSQPGYSALLPMPLIKLNGAAAGGGASGLIVAASGGQSVIRGLIVDNFGHDGIVLHGDRDVVAGCYIGVDETGNASAPNGGNGIVATGQQDLIGGTTLADRNVISGNALAGIEGIGQLLQVSGNWIGIGTRGNNQIRNGHEGVVATNGSVIGGAGAAGNVISGNGYSGILVLQQAQVQVLGNLIGTDASGTTAVSNGASPAAPWGDGVTVFGNASIGVTNANAIPVRNVISGNAGAGVSIQPRTPSTNAITNLIVGNFIGTNATGSRAVPNAGDGIDVAANSVLIGTAQTVVGPGFVSGGNLISGNARNGIAITSAQNVQIYGNYVGTDLTGMTAVPNGGNGILGLNNQNDQIGGQGILRNVISGNRAAGVSLRQTVPTVKQFERNQLVNNYIGINAAATAVVGNAGSGVEIMESGDSVGAPNDLQNVPQDGNVISGNGGSGIYVGGGPFTAGGVLLPVGNRIGANFIGTGGAGNGARMGNRIDGVTLDGASQTRVGGPGNANVIANNGRNGVTVFSVPDGNDGPNGLNNLISRNSILANQNLGIDLGGDDVTPNDSGDNDTGPNLLQNYPVLQFAEASPNSATVRLLLDTQPGTYTLEFFANAGFLTAASVTVTMRNQVFNLPLAGLNVGQVLIATATATQSGNTSEFSDAVAVTVAPPQVVAAAFLPAPPLPRLTFVFSEPLDGFSASSIHVVDADGNAVLLVSAKYDSGAKTATYFLPFALPPGKYTATLSARVLLAGGIQLDGNGDSIPGDDYTFTFTVPPPPPPAADSSVGFADLLALAQNYGKTAASPAADWNGDGVVDFADLLLLSQSYGRRRGGS